MAKVKTKLVEMSIEAYGKTIGKSRGTIYRWAQAKLDGKASKLPKGVSAKMVAGHFVIVVKE